MSMSTLILKEIYIPAGTTRIQTASPATGN
jgi:hypothetical protein